MPSPAELLKRGKSRFKKTSSTLAPRSAPKKIKRSGPQRPYQEYLQNNPETPTTITPSPTPTTKTKTAKRTTSSRKNKKSAHKIAIVSHDTNITQIAAIHDTYPTLEATLSDTNITQHAFLHDTDITQDHVSPDTNITHLAPLPNTDVTQNIHPPDTNITQPTNDLTSSSLTGNVVRDTVITQPDTTVTQNTVLPDTFLTQTASLADTFVTHNPLQPDTDPLPQSPKHDTDITRPARLVDTYVTQLGVRRDTLPDTTPRVRLPTSPVQLALLKAIIEAQNSTADGISSPFLTKKFLASAAAVNPRSVNTSIQRLLRAQWMERLEFRGGSTGGSVFRVPHSTRRLFQSQTDKSRVLPDTIHDTQHDTVSVRSSSSDFKNLITSPTTTKEEILRKHLEVILEREGGEHSHIGLLDLIPIWRKGAHEDPIHFATSLSHLLFHLKDSELSKGIKFPKAWALKKLSEGYVDAPAGYLSWEEQQSEKITTALRAKHARLKQQRSERERLEFEIWYESLTDSEYKHRLGAMPFARGSTMAEKLIYAQYETEILGREIIDAEEG